MLKYLDKTTQDLFVGFCNKLGYTPMRIMASNGNFDIVKLENLNTNEKVKYHINVDKNNFKILKLISGRYVPVINLTDAWIDFCNENALAEGRLEDIITF